MVAPITQLEEDRSIRPAKSPGGFDDGFKYRLQLVGRPGNHGENVTNGGLIFERLLQLPFACLFRLEQPRVLDGDDGLVGESLEQGHLVWSEWLHLEPPQHNCPDGLISL